MLNFPRFCVLVILFGLISITGCGWWSNPLVPVKGKISFLGQPLESGTVIFTPDDSRGNSGPIAYAEIQPDGSYELQTEEKPGAIAGWHRITVVAVGAASTAYQGDRFSIPLSLIPEKYRDPDLSGIIREVKAGEENQIHIDLN